MKSLWDRAGSIASVALLLGFNGCAGNVVAPPGSAFATSSSSVVGTRPISAAKPDSKKNELLYVSDSGGTAILVYKYPEGSSAGELTTPYAPFGLCTDKKGDVFVVTRAYTGNSYIYEYAHGGSQPIATLDDPGIPTGCASDPVTGNLAVTNYERYESQPDGNIAIFAHASGTPTTFSDSNVAHFLFCTYDNRGNLFATSGSRFIDELPQKGGELSEITPSASMVPVSIQWVKGDLVVTDAMSEPKGPLTVYSLRVSGSNATVVGSTQLLNRGKHYVINGQYLLKGNVMVGPGPLRGAASLIQYWQYPRGGKPTRVIHPRDIIPFGFVISMRS